MVTDSGKGIAPERMAELFQAFNRLGAEMGGVEGTGIGLTITRKLMDLMGGKVGAQSTLNVGSTFWIEMPAEHHIDSSFASLPLASSLAPLPAAQRRQVLCIDDNPVNIKLFVHMLAKRPNIHLISAHSPGLGIELARAHRPDAVLLDINMPGMDGYEVLEIFKAEPELSKIPVVAVTANALPRDIEKGRSAGFADYLTKPIDVNGLLQTLDRLLSAETKGLP